ncbi:hypothetical protein JI75_04475 [Berryella intestinalis]|uniref:HTH tetR-type domain-containing protein n=1 Tax=Berryella intestinalis TaxID=1531429 RepID=A0A0A8B5E0_9ACTN|nr:TetR/AcrR family transcriptional regulator [Berryella intestinalis]AJC12033.1 hypothetical protein JI75_04475 [Berryella intestinalis]
MAVDPTFSVGETPGSRALDPANDDIAARKRRIVDAAVEIGSRQGLAAISARGVARAADVSVGYLYKVFPAKSDIVVAAATHYFEQALYKDLCHTTTGESYIDYCRRLCDRATEAVATFRGEWLRDAESLPHADLIAARIRMGSAIEHAKKGLVAVLENDAAIDWEGVLASVNAASVAEFTARSLVESLREGSGGHEVLLALLERGLYRV